MTHDAKGAEPIYSVYEGNDIYEELLVDFVAAVPAKYEEIASAVTGRNQSEVSRLCHKFCGSSGTYGFPQLAALLKTMELSAKNAPSGEAGLFDKLDANVADLKKMCHQIATGRAI